MLGGGIGHRPFARRMRRNRAIVDDPSSLRRLPPHQAKCRPRAQEHPRQIDVHCIQPVLHRNVVNRRGRGENPCIVKEHIKPPRIGGKTRKRGLDRARIRHVAGQHHRLRVILGHSLQRLAPPCEQPDPPSGLQKRFRRCPSDPVARACHDDCFHVTPSSGVSSSGATGARKSSIPSGCAGRARRFRTTQRN